jgi:class 3 adenylate cyclase
MTTQDSDSLAILFADVAGSTRLYERRGNAIAQQIIGLCLGFLRDVVTRSHGVVIKEIGDEVMCTFCLPDDAACAAEEMQRTVQQASAFGKFENEQVRIRVGFHYGPVVRDQEDVFGDAVNVAARVAAQAKAQQILTTRETMERLPEARRASARLIDKVMVKGKTEEVELHELLWDIENLTVMQGGLKADGVRLTARVTYREKEYFLDAEHPILRCGRGEENDLVVADGLVSRLHARLELRKGKVVLVDQSLNGTFVQMEGEPEIHVRRDEQPVRGRGAICLGRTTLASPEWRIMFTCG